MKHRTLIMSLTTMLWAATSNVAKGYFAQAKACFGAPVQAGYFDYIKNFFVEEAKPPPPFFSLEYLQDFLVDDLKALWAKNSDGLHFIWYFVWILVYYASYQMFKYLNLPRRFPTWFTIGSASNEEAKKEAPAPSTGFPFPSGSPVCSEDKCSEQLNERLNVVEGLLIQGIKENQQMRDEQTALLMKLMDQSEELKKYSYLGRIEAMEDLRARAERLNNDEEELEIEIPEDEHEGSNNGEEFNEQQQQQEYQQPFVIETEDSIIYL